MIIYKVQQNETFQFGYVLGFGKNGIYTLYFHGLSFHMYIAIIPMTIANPITNVITNCSEDGKVLGTPAKLEGDVKTRMLTTPIKPRTKIIPR